MCIYKHTQTNILLGRSSVNERLFTVRGCQVYRRPGVTPPTLANITAFPTHLLLPPSPICHQIISVSESIFAHPTHLHLPYPDHFVLFFPMPKARQIKHQQAASNRRQHLLRTRSAASESAGLGEVVGGTLAECAVVCCCCPCGLINLLVLALYKVPAGLCRRALRNKSRRKLNSKGLLPQRRRRCKCGCEEVETPIHPIGCDDAFSGLIEWGETEELDKEAMELEKEMWDMFYSTGFWRSCSTRESPQNPIPSVNSADSLCHLASPQPDCR